MSDTESMQHDSQIFPMPALRDESNFGRRIRRTMTLLSTSTSVHHNTVKIMFYGQSITRQEWSGILSKYLKEAFPHADMIIENRAVSGFASDMLKRVVESDLLTFYPDLIILQDYGGEDNYEYILAAIRRLTAAEVMLQTDHVHITSEAGFQWHEQHCSEWLPKMADKYGFELIDIRNPWKQYLKDNDLKTEDLLRDDVHLNAQGNFLMAELIKPYFRYHEGDPDAGFRDSVKTYVVGKDVFWNNGKLILEFDGNRVDAVVFSSPETACRSGSRAASSPNAEVRIDGKRPSKFPECYTISRPNQMPGKDWPWTSGAIVCITWNNPLVSEEWSLKITETSESLDSFGFEVSGSVTSFDGRGKSTEKFVSDSGRVVIAPEDWFMKKVRDVRKDFSVPAGFVMKWNVLPLFTDLYTCPKLDGTAHEFITNLACGLSDSRHILELTANGYDQIPISEIRVYKPALHSPFMRASFPFQG